MSLIFISHSSQDSDTADELTRRLEEQGHRSIFLDFDPELGIAAGTDWEQPLYSKLRACQAVIYLCSPASLASKWCFAEITHARSLGKALFPIKIAPCEPDTFLQDTQFIDLSGGGWNLSPLWRGLGEAGLEDRFVWDGKRPPYPGLTAFHEKDAPLFFGRKIELEKGIEQLRSLRRSGGPRLILYQGASGSGKSSLVRAGLVPTLKKFHADWLVVVDPFRPLEGLGDPYDNLAAVFQKTFRVGTSHTKHDLRKRFSNSAEPHVLLQIARELAEARNRREATVLLIIDQFEELFGQVIGNAQSFLGWLGEALTAAHQLPSCPLLVLATLRSDFLTSFQNAQELEDIEPAWFPVRPVPKRRFGEIIERPAEVVGLELKPGLVSKILEDAETEDALPMLAFTMAELWKRYGKDGELNLVEYDDLGGIRGSIKNAAEDAFNRSKITPELEGSLRKAFLRMAQVNESGQYVRRLAKRDELPKSVLPILDDFSGAESRLLIKREDTYEVAHETLFRVWDKLKGWLDEEREFFLWSHRLQSRLSDWKQSGREESALIRGKALVEAEHWLVERFDDLQEDEQQFIRDSTARRDRELALIERRRRRLLFAAFGATAVFMLLASFSLNQWRSAEEERIKALAHQLAAQAELLRNQQPDLVERSLLLGLESLKRFRTAEGDHAVRQAMELLPPVVKNVEYAGFVRDVQFSPDGRWLAVGNAEGATILDAESGVEHIPLIQGIAVYSVAVAPNNEWVATAGSDGTARIWDLETGTQLHVLQHGSTVWSVAVRQDGRVLATGSWDSTVRLWDAGSGQELMQMSHEESVYQVAFSPNGALLASTGKDGTARIWDAETGEELHRVRDHCSFPVCGSDVVEFSNDGRFVITGGRDGDVYILDIASGTQYEGPTHTGEVSAIALSPDGRFAATGGGENFPGKSGEAIVWDLATRDEIARFVHSAPVRALAFHPNGTHLATSSEDRTANVWDLGSGESVARLVHDWIVFDVTFNPDGRILATGGGATLRLVPWNASSESSFQNDVTTVRFSADGDLLAVWSGDVLEPAGTVVVIQPGDGREIARLPHAGQADITDVAFSSDLALVAVATNESVRVVDVGSGQQAGEYRHSDEGVYHHTVEFAPDASLLAVGSSVSDSEDAQDQGLVSLINWSTGEERFRVQHPAGVYALAFSADGQWLASASSDVLGRWGETRIDAVDRDETIWIDFEQPADTLSFSPDGRFLIVGGNEKSARVFALSTGRQVAALPHEDFVQVSSFSPDSQWAATGSLDNTARIWATNTWLEVARILHDDAVYAVAFSPGENLLATGSLDNTVKVSVWDLDSMLHRACSGLSRNLSEEEWRTYVGDESYESTCPGR